MAIIKINNNAIDLDAAEIPNLDTSKITTGTLSADRIDNNSLANITSLPSGVGGLALQSVQTTGFTAVKGNLYPCDTTSAAFTVTLPASAAVGDQVQILDYAGTFNTNNLTVNPNGLKIQTDTGNRLFNTNRIALTFTYVDSTQGWSLSSGYLESTNPFYIPPYDIDFLVVAGGGSGGYVDGGGGGAGGYRTSTQTLNSGTVITVTVGDGGAAISSGGSRAGNTGSDSSISGSGLTTITSAGGGGGTGKNGGSGGGAYYADTFGSGNTPSTSPSQGNNGGASTTSPNHAGGGGGAGAVGVAGGSGSTGGAGTASSITGSSVTRAGGGGGFRISGPVASGGTGGGGDGGLYTISSATSGTINTGSGGGGSAGTSNFAGGGGKGVVILSMPLASFSGTTTGSPTESTSGSNKILTFTGDGSYTT
jgi:hypothetical protein